MFKIGDKVRIIMYGDDTNEHPVGECGTIIRTLGKYYDVELYTNTGEYDLFDHYWPCKPEELELLPGE